VLARIEKSKMCGTIFLRVCVLNRTSVYLHSFVYVIDHLRTAIFILAVFCLSRALFLALKYSFIIFY